MSKKKDAKPKTIAISKETHTKIKIHIATTGQSMSEFITIAVEEKIKRLNA